MTVREDSTIMMQKSKEDIGNLADNLIQGPRGSISRPILLAVLVGLSFFLSAFFLLTREATSGKFFNGPSIKAPGIDPLEPTPQPDEPKASRYDFRLSGSNTFYQIMSVLNVPGADSRFIAKAARPVYDLRQLKMGTVLRVYTEEDKLSKIEYRISEFETLLVERDGSIEGGYKVSKAELPHEVRQTRITGAIENSLYEDALKAGADAQAVMNLSDIFAWDIDFASDIRKGDTFSFLGEVLYVEGQPVRTDRILGAEMVNGGKTFTAVYFEGDGEKGSYYNAEGKSLRRSLLKSPLRFRRITSHFSRGRFHPILKKYRPHHGIDYAAPVGTPIESAGSGIVRYAGWKGGYGNFIEIRHNNGYSTAYGHLSRIAKGVRTGAKVSQGDVVGYVGSTGISTGPHLHYEVRAGGRLINPLSIKAVADRSITKKEKARFMAKVEDIQKRLSGGATFVASNTPLKTAK